MLELLKTTKSFGSLSSPMAIIGEAFGAEEEKQGQPFCGSSGQLQDSVLVSAGWMRQKTYMDNVFTFHPPNNNIDSYIEFHDRKPPTVTQTFLDYQKALGERLSQFDGNIIVAVGATSMYALTGYYNKITKRRGSIYPCTLVPGKKVLITVHPAAVLREYDLIYPYTMDFKRAVIETTYPEIRYPQRGIQIASSFNDAYEYVTNIKDGIVGFDIEVVNREISCLAIAKSPSDVMCIPFYSKGSNAFTLDDEAIIWQAIGILLKDQNVEKVFHNAVFDCTFMFNRYGLITRNIGDTMIGQAIVAPNLPKGLDFITSIYTREPYYKDDGKQYFKLFTDEESFWRYNAKDAACTIECYAPIMRDVKAMGNYDVYKRHVRLVPPLMLMSDHGIKMDETGLQVMSKDAEAELEKLQKQLNEIAGEELNIGSPKQIQTYFYVKKGLKAYVSRKTGSVTADEEALTRIAIKGFKEAEIILKMREIAKANSTYYKIKLVGGRLKCSYNPVGAANTGRLSSGKTIFGDGGNMQNQPRNMKNMMIAD